MLDSLKQLSYARGMVKPLGKDSTCSIARSLDLLGEKWMMLIMREALIAGATRFSEFRDALGIAPNVLTNRLAVLVDEGVMERRSYREDGSRLRDEYVLTEAGKGLNFLIAGLAGWGRANRPRPDGTSPVYSDLETGERVELSFVTASGRRVGPESVAVVQELDALAG
jgi:DNA-binding HxlR family transcriptional regulator